MNDILINIISIIVTAVVIPLITLLGSKLIKWVSAKINNQEAAKLLENASTIVLSAVKAVFQTYVEALKKEGKFNADAQKVALEQAKNIALSQLTTETKDFISETFGNVDVWLVTQIEATINTLKNR